MTDPVRSSMALAMRHSGGRNNALRRAALFHTCASLQVKWRNKYRNTTGFIDDQDDDYPSKKYVEYERRVLRAEQKRNVRNLARTITFEDFSEDYQFNVGSTPKQSQRKSSFKNKRTNEWEAYLKYEGDWEKFCKKFTRFAEFEQPRRSRHGRLHNWEFEDEDMSDNDGEDPAFSSKRQTKTKPKQHSATRTVITIGARTDRVALGLPPTGSLTMEELKAAFRASALKWHPDRHEGSSKDMAEEKFKACGNAYRALCSVLSQC